MTTPLNPITAMNQGGVGNSFEAQQQQREIKDKLTQDLGIDRSGRKELSDRLMGKYQEHSKYLKSLPKRFKNTNDYTYGRFQKRKKQQPRSCSVPYISRIFNPFAAGGVIIAVSGEKSQHKLSVRRAMPPCFWQQRGGRPSGLRLRHPGTAHRRGQGRGRDRSVFCAASISSCIQGINMVCL